MARSPVSSRTREEILALHDLYWNQGETLEQIGKRIGRSREGVRQLFVNAGLATRSLDEHVALRQERQAREVEEQRERIIELYKEHGTVPAVVERVGLPYKAVAAVIDSMPNRAAYQRRGTPTVTDPEKLQADLRTAARELGEPLAAMAYLESAARLSLAAYNTQVRVFGSWLEACKAAGVRSNPSLGRRSSSITLDDCVNAVCECIIAYGRTRVSYATYEQWAADNGKPSASTVRLVRDDEGRMVKWSGVLALALDKLGMSVG